MRDNGLIVKMKRTKKYNSYKGEIVPAIENIVQRNFRANKPNEKMYTDITEFLIPAGKIYLSPIIDCFDVMVAVWSISTSLNAKLVNHMLDKYYDTLNKEKPLIHSNRGAHYRWLGWIERMKIYGFTRNIPKKVFSYDNVTCEDFFRKMRCFTKKWQGVSIEIFTTILNEYIIWYNTKRIKESLGYKIPIDCHKSLGLKY